MKKLEWKQEYSTGIARIDQEHKQLIEQINLLFEQLDHKLDILTIEAMLGEIQVDISAHFAFEELLMHEARYPEYKDHKEDHENLLDQINDIIFCFAANPDICKELLMMNLSDWFSNHFVNFDIRLHNQLS